jgi:hypothetical protein
MAGDDEEHRKARQKQPINMKTLATRFLGIAALGGVLAVLPARADVITFSASYPAPIGTFQTPDWTSFVTIPKFNPALGTLNSISFHILSSVQGSAQSENTSPSSGTDVTLTLSAQVKLNRPASAGGGQLVVATPAVANTFAATAYDGVTDFAGTSGVTYAGLSATKANSALYTSDADKALFTGTGTINLPISAAG